MKIIRYIDSRGRTGQAAQQQDGTALEIEGDLYGQYRVTERRAEVVKRLAPIQPAAIVCIGLNYRFHAEETKAAIPPHPVVFMKLPGAVQHPDEPILLPRHLRSDKVDYEGELAVVIGKAARNVSRENALAHVLGYTCANDVSARDWQRDFGGGQFCHAKSFDTFCPLGPVLVTKDEIANPNALRIRSILNGTVMQDSSTADMIFDVATALAFLSADKTLPAGTVILTGTPEGVGFARKPPVWLKPGDTISVEVEGIGTLTNPVVAG